MMDRKRKAVGANIEQSGLSGKKRMKLNSSAAQGDSKPAAVSGVDSNSAPTSISNTRKSKMNGTVESSSVNLEIPKRSPKWKAVSRFLDVPCVPLLAPMFEKMISKIKVCCETFFNM